MLNTDFKAAIDSLQSDPIACSSLALRALEELNNGTVKIMDPTSPFVFLMESSVVMYCNGLDNCGDTLTRLYKNNAKNYDDLYRHISNKDLAGRFSIPGDAKFMFYLDIEEIKARAVLVGDGSKNKKLTIARNSIISVSEVELTLMYPIDIIITEYGAITVKYDISKKNPLQNIADSIIAAELRKEDSTTYLYFEIPINQVSISNTTFSVTGSQGLKKTLNFSNKFYFLRAFMRNDGEEWTEVNVMHNAITIDTTSVTIIASVDTLNRTVSIEIPQVYKNDNLLKDNVRIDIYTTQGNINIPLSNISNKLFKASWKDYESTTTSVNKFASPMSVFNNLKIASDDTISGGEDGKTFDELRDQVVNRTVVTEGVPISSVQLAAAVNDKGYDVVLGVDNVTDRTLLATKLLPDGSDYSLGVTPIGSITATHATTLTQMLNNTLSVRANTDQITTLPSALFELVNGALVMVSDDEVTSLIQQRKNNIDTFVNNVNARKFYFCPYFMRHNYANDEYSVKPYRLDKPKILSKSIENENTALDYSSNIIAFNIQVDSGYTGYSIYVQLNPSDTLKALAIEDLKLQMRIADENDRYYYWFNGTLVTPLDPTTGKPVDDYYVYRFHLPTNWSITDNEEILIGSYKIPFKLSGFADIYTIVRKSGLNSSLRTSMDLAVNVNLFDDWTVSNSGDYYAMIQERVNITLGTYLKNLWCRQRPSIDDTPFQQYLSDVYAVWDEDQYQLDQWGYKDFTIDDQGVLRYKILYPKGSIKVDELGNPIVLHSKGDYIKDALGNPIPEDGVLGIKRYYDVVLLDGKYYFTTNAAAINYRESIKDDIDVWLTDMALFDQEVLERTDILVRPKVTEGYIKAVLDNGIETFIETTQSLVVNFTIDERTASSADAITNIKSLTTKTIHDLFVNNTTISNSDIVAALKTALGEWVIGIKVSGFLNDSYNTLTILDNSICVSIPKRLAINSSLEVIVEDDITINFITHTVATSTTV